MSTQSVPQASRPTEDVQGHWLLARLGKRVLRPGGAGLTRQLLEHARLDAVEVVELAPGLGITAGWIIERGVKSYAGVDADPDAARRISEVVEGRGTCVVADAATTGLDDASADVVVGEAMLTMQSDRGKGAIIAEAARVLRAGGRYAIHELALAPDDLDPAIAEEIRLGLVKSIRVNARPLTVEQWTSLLAEHGFVVEWVGTAPMSLLEPRRNIADEGLFRTLRILGNVIRDSDARKRVLEMRSVFRKYHDQLRGVAIVATLQMEQS